MDNQKETKEPIVAGGLTQPEIDKLKAKHGRLVRITVKKDGKLLHFWLKKEMDMDTFHAVVKLSTDDPVEAAKVTLQECQVAGDEGYQDNVSVLRALMPELSRLREELDTEVKEY